jgi:hypothetical protein
MGVSPAAHIIYTSFAPIKLLANEQHQRVSNLIFAETQIKTKEPRAKNYEQQAPSL